MTKVPQLMSDRERMIANAGKFVVQRMYSNTPIDYLCLPFFDKHHEFATIFDTLEAADAAAEIENEKSNTIQHHCRAVVLVNNLDGPRIYL